MYGLKPVPFKDGTLLFLELLSTGFAVISLQQRGMEIGVNGVCGQFRKSDRWVPPTFFGAGAPGRTWEKNAPDLRDLFALRIEEARADQAVPYSPPILPILPYSPPRISRANGETTYLRG